jgi:hypothetical protein
MDTPEQTTSCLDEPQSSRPPSIPPMHGYNKHHRPADLVKQHTHTQTGDRASTLVQRYAQLNINLVRQASCMYQLRLPFLRKQHVRLWHIRRQLHNRTQFKPLTPWYRATGYAPNCNFNSALATANSTLCPTQLRHDQLVISSHTRPPSWWLSCASTRQDSGPPGTQPCTAGEKGADQHKV